MQAMIVTEGDNLWSSTAATVAVTSFPVTAPHARTGTLVAEWKPTRLSRFPNFVTDSRFE